MKLSKLLLALSLAIYSTPVSAGQTTTSPALSMEKAQKVAISSVPGKVLGWGLELDNDVPTYVFIIKGSNSRINEVEINGDTGEKGDIGIEIERGGNGGSRKTSYPEDLAMEKEAKLSRQQAEQKALKKFSGNVDSWELEFEEGKLVYEFMVIKKGEKKVVGVDAKNGTYTEITRYLQGNSY